MPIFRSLSGAVLTVAEVVALTSEGSRVQLEPLPSGETLVLLVPEHTVAIVDRGSSSFKIKPISPIRRTPTDLIASAKVTEEYRIRNARMRRCLRIGFHRVEMGDNVLQPIDFVE